MTHNTREIEEAINRKIQRYAMAYEGILPQESIDRSKQHWKNELLDFADEITHTLHHQLQKARQELSEERTGFLNHIAKLEKTHQEELQKAREEERGYAANTYKSFIQYIEEFNEPHTVVRICKTLLAELDQDKK